ncbi:RDD family protein [Streptomyces daghestanicus]|uniref:RDD family protein n=1 Tax=Streptomyces daghestanicus TaxID=66885 RepID=A0ABQ3Q9I6_9ACTN|nr:RDD family protein [Streptomyces daghestanicus]GGU34928.1 hypothetical protein GCM10010259_26650 [Streptomyces daghestanicus]GHI33932.1 hypothetical protein Sdagh_56620 [Streptomyces daghestanicus]
MSAPTPAPGDDRPREGYYPDPSIPGYVRYWNGAAWVPGTSRPAPVDGEPLAPPSGADRAAPSVEETGPHFFDEDPAGPEPAPVASTRTPHGSRPEPASGWGADPARQTGLPAGQGAPAWPAPQGADPRVPRPAAPAEAPADAAAEAESDGTVLFRRPGPGDGPSPVAPASGDDDPGTMKFRAVAPRPATPRPAPAAPREIPGAPAPAPAAPREIPREIPGAPAPAPQPPAAPGPAPAPSGPQLTPGALPPRTPGPAPVPAAPPARTVPAPAPQPPLTTGPGGGQSSWAQQVHHLASGGGESQQPVAPWRPPVDDVFQAAARRQAAARPAGLGKRLAARLLDTLVLAAVTAVPAVPLGMKAADHISAKIDEARLSGETVTVWLLDGTTSVYLGVVLAVLLLFGVVYEALPTAKWGRTLGKKLCGLEVRDIEAHEPPTFGASLRRWLVYSVPGLLAIGVVGVLWCLFDRPWHQCWHDKAARTFVAG